jgi:AraC-like DNA-binding protein
MHIFPGLRPAKIRFYIRCSIQCGITANEILAGTQISESDLDNDNFLIDISQYIRIVSNLRKLYGRDDLAFYLGENLTLGDLGVLGYAVMSSSTAGQAQTIWETHMPLFFGNLIKTSYPEKGNIVKIRMHSVIEIRPNLLRFFIEEKLSYDHAIQRLIGMEKYTLSSLSLTYDEPRNVQLYKKLMGRNVHFSCDENLLVVHAEGYSVKLMGANQEMNQFCLDKLNDLHQKAIVHQKSYTYKLKEYLSTRLDCSPSSEAAAKHFNCSPRTFARKLKSEGASYNETVASLRKEMAEHYFATTDLSTKEIADKLGFSNASSFRRFFKTTTGMTTSEFKYRLSP